MGVDAGHEEDSPHSASWHVTVLWVRVGFLKSSVCKVEHKTGHLLQQPHYGAIVSGLSFLGVLLCLSVINQNVEVLVFLEWLSRVVASH